MKNFTKQNFKTNPLWIRLLIMAFMLLAGAGNVWAATYLAGDFNNWSSNNNSYNFTYSGNIGTLSISLSAKSTYNFKVVHDGTWYTNPEQGTMTRGNCSNWPITTSGGNDNNTKIMADIQGTYIFKFDKSNKQLTITYPAVTKVFIRGGMNSWNGEECEGTDGVFTYKGSANNNTEFKFVANENNWDGEGLYNGMSIDDTKNTTKLKLTRNNNDNTKIVNTDGVAFEIVIDINTGKYWIQKPSCTDPKDSDFKITCVPSEGYYTYNGLEQKPTAEWNNSSNKGGEVTTYISSSSSSYTAATSKNAGTYYVYVTSVAGGNFCDLTTKTYIGSYDIKQAAQTGFSISNTTTSICGKTVTVTTSGGQDGAISYSITEDKTTNTNATISSTGVLTVTSPGTVTVQAKRAATTNYKDITDTKKFTFTMPTSVSITRGDNSTANLCEESTLDLTATVTGGSGNITYSWIKTSGNNDWTITNTSDQTCTVTAGTGTAKFKVTATRCSVSVEKEIELTADTKATLNWSAMPVGRDFLIIGESLTATVTDPNGTVGYVSGNANVIAVEGEKLVAKATGTATVTAKQVTVGTGYCSAANITKQNVTVKYFNVAGTANLCGDAWNTTANPMTYDNGVWSKTFEAKPAAEYQFKVTKEFWPQIAETPIVDNSNGNLTCTVKRITNSKGETYDNIFFTTPTKGNITIKYTEAKGAYVEFEPICITDDDVSAGTINAPESLCGVKDFTLALDGTTSLTDYVTSVQWQKKNSNVWENTSAEQTNLTSGTHKYKAIVTWTCSWTERDGSARSCTKTKETGEISVKVQEPISDLKMEITSGAMDVYCPENQVNVKITYKGDISKSTLTYDENQIFISGGAIVNNATFNFTIKQSGIVTLELEDCNSTKHTAQLDFTVMAVPVIPEIEVVQSEIIKCGDAFIKKGKVLIKNYNSSYSYVIGDNDNDPVDVTVEDENAYIYFDFQGSFTIKAKNICGVFGEKTTLGDIVITQTDVKLTPTLSSTPIVKCGEGDNAYTPGTLVITNYNADYNYAITPSVGTPTIDGTNATYSINAKVATKYTVTATHRTYSCSSEQANTTVALTDNTPTITNAAITAGKDAVCVNTGTTLTASATTDKGTLSYKWNTEATTASIETGDLTENTTYSVTITAINEGCPSTSEVSKTITVNPVSQAAVELNSVTYDRASKKFSFSATLVNAGCSQDIYVGYQYKLAGNDTWNNELVKIHRLTGENAVNGAIFSKTDISIPNATSGQTYTFRAYAINGYPNYYESSAVYSSTTDVLVQEGYTIYVRRPNSNDGTSVYSNFYAYSSVKGSTMYVKSGSISGQAETNNTGGTIMTEVFTDCEGYVWDSFVAESGQTQFYVRALNDGDTKGWATFSQTATIEANKDNYFYLSSWSDGQYGVSISEIDAPALDIRIAALGSTDVKSNNMASFAALYLSGNCSGKEIKEYQWMYRKNNGTSWSNYSGIGSTWNNIRPTVAGEYKLVCTFEDDYTMDSNTITITNSTGSYTADDLINIKSSLPIIMVNTGGNYGFPDCVNNSDYPSKHAGELKEKLSVDVKIKVGDEIVYDKKARMNYRGSSSLNFKKKSYAFCPGADNCGTDKDKSADFVETTKIDMLSLITKGVKTSVADKDWVLYAANPDPSMMRNILAMEAFSAMTRKWGVKNQYVELYVDGKYEGVYVFMDKVTQNDNGRVQITWDVKDPTKRGFILKFDKTDVEDRYEGNGDKKTFESKLGTGNTGVISYGTEIDQRFEIEYPEKKKIEKAGGSWDDVYGFVKGKVDAFEEALSKGDFATVRTIIDYESWADFFLINEFSKNADGFRASCIFVYENNLLKAYPLWDYELSFDNEVRQEHNVDKETGLLVESTTYSKVTGNNGTFPCPFWWTGNYYNSKTYKGLLDDPCFVSMIKTRWDQHKVGALSASSLQKLVSGYNTALTKTDNTTTYNTPQKREAQRWPYTGEARGKSDCNQDGTGYYGINEGTVQNFTESKGTLDKWIENTGRRYGDNGTTGGLEGEITKLSSEIDFVISAVADKTTTSPWRPVSVTVSSNSSYTYAITPEPAQVKVNGNVYTIYMARPTDTEGENFTAIPNAYTFIATSGTQDECGSSTGEPAKATVNITLEDVVENCDK